MAYHIMWVAIEKLLLLVLHYSIGRRVIGDQRGTRWTLYKVHHTTKFTVFALNPLPYVLHCRRYEAGPRYRVNTREFASERAQVARASIVIDC